MIYGSVCSGIEAATMAWHPLGWSPAFFSEVEKFPSLVLAHHYGSNMPGGLDASNGIPNHGDMTKFEEWPDHAIDLLVGGTPCQSFSVAGLRKGLADPRGNLMLTYLAIARRYQPRWLVWENVPGVLSSNGGRDFAAFIRGLEECGYHAAWRVLDAQYVRVDGFGRAVPQRRRRVFVVGYLGDWRRAAAVLLEPESLRGDPAPRREAGQRPSPTISARPTGGGGLGTDFDLDGGLIASTGNVAHCLNAGAMGRIDYETETMIASPVPVQAMAFMENVRHELRVSDCTDALTRGGGKPGQGYAAALIKETAGWAVRRLTPRECERLQGFPDGFTDINPNGKQTADGPRYKALGNSMAVNVMRWIGRRMEMVDRIAAEIDRRAA